MRGIIEGYMIRLDLIDFSSTSFLHEQIAVWFQWLLLISHEKLKGELWVVLHVLGQQSHLLKNDISKCTSSTCHHWFNGTSTSSFLYWDNNYVWSNSNRASPVLPGICCLATDTCRTWLGHTISARIARCHKNWPGTVNISLHRQKVTKSTRIKHSNTMKIPDSWGYLHGIQSFSRSFYWNPMTWGSPILTIEILGTSAGSKPGIWEKSATSEPIQHELLQ